MALAARALWFKGQWCRARIDFQFCQPPLNNHLLLNRRAVP